MKKIFYKIFFTLLIITYIPLVLLYSFHGLYMKQYVENKKISELSEITYIINKNTLNSLKAGEKEELEKKKDIKIEVIDAREDGYKIFEYFNRKVWKIDLKKLKVNDTRIRFERVSNLLDRIYIIKKVDRNKYVIISSLMVIPDVIYRTILSSYFYVTPFLVVIILILAYFISKKMAVPIEVLEDISTRVLNLDFSKSIDFKGKDELNILGNNIASMADNLKENNDELKILNKKLKYELEKNQKFMKFEKEFINSVSHELKTPIAIINGYIEVLQDKIIINEEEIEKIYSVMYKEGLYLDKMIKDLNSYHSYEHEFFTIKKERFNFKEFLQMYMPYGIKGTWDAFSCAQTLESIGMRIIDKVEDYRTVRFRSLEAIHTYFIKHSPDLVDINRYQLFYMNALKEIKEKGFYELTTHQFLVVAQKI